MQKIKTFFRTLVLSCTSPKYYADVLKARFGFSFKYFLFLQFLSSVAIASLIIIPLSQFNVSSLLTSVQDSYPEDLAISVNDGRLSINQPLPYRIPVPGDWYEELGEEEEMGPDVRNIAVFQSDQNVTGAADVFDQDSLVVLTETSIYVRDDSNGGLRMYPIPDGESFELNEGVINQAFSQVVNHPFIKDKLYVPFIAAFFLLFVFPMMVIGGLITSAIYGFFVWLMTRVLSGALFAGATLSFKKSVQVTFHSMTLITVIQMVLRIIGEGHRLEGWWYLLAFLVWTGFVLHQAFQSPAAPSTPAAQVSAPKAKVKTKSPSKPAKKGKK